MVSFSNSYSKHCERGARGAAGGWVRGGMNIQRHYESLHVISMEDCLSSIEETCLSMFYFTGSVKRSVGYQLPLTLDASDSKDPDFPDDKSGITFTWMCKKKEEEFPASIPFQSDSGGCWENGTYVFGGDSNVATVFTGDFYQNSLYDFRVIVRKGTRKAQFDQTVEVLRGQPPTMVIE